jgi:ribulose-5-phosphate 4-epimerase/fuculose-1-phosphate aldolase
MDMDNYVIIHVHAIHLLIWSVLNQQHKLKYGQIKIGLIIDVV